MTGPEPDELVLAGGFPAATAEQWQQLVARVLKRPADVGGPPERDLVTVTADGIEINPLYAPDAGRLEAAGYPGAAPFVRGRAAAGRRAGWDVRQRHEHPDPATAREQILEDLEGGVTSLWLGLGDGMIPADALPEVLAGVYLDLAGVVLDAGADFAAAAEAFLAAAAGRGTPPGALTGCLGADPLGTAARAGGTASLEDAAALARRCAGELPGMRAIAVDALAFHEAGATDAQELGCALAAGAEYLRALHAAGLGGAAAAGQLEFRFAATADQFMTIAKLRAARRTWARVAAACGIPAGAAGQRQHAVTSWPMLTRRDPWNNILRCTLACFGAAVGGADAITVTPFDAAAGQPDQLGRRVARNVQALLAEEAHVARVIDPAGGSGYVEDLTGQLAGRAWAFFTGIERRGGLRAALDSGFIAAELTLSRDRRMDAVARGADAITGVSVFPLAGETPLQRPPGRPETTPGRLPRIRWAQRHEQLRDRADAHARAAGAPPALTLVLAGDSRPAAAQADRVTGLLAAIGVTTVTAGPDSAAGGGAVAICSSPGTAPGELAAAVAQARAGGAVFVAVAAGGSEPNGTGADAVISAGTDVVAFGEKLLTSLEVAR